MKPKDLTTKIFVDGGDPAQTRSLKERLGWLDGQTTNPSLIAKNPEVAARLAKGEKFTTEELLHFYRQVVTELSEVIPDGSISIEVYADAQTTSEAMLAQGREMHTWIPNAHIKFPSTLAGLAAAEQAAKDGIRCNLTLCFSQAQAAAVYRATLGSEGHFVSPFVGRLDDRGENGMDLIDNILRMYSTGDGHVSVLTASIRTLDHLLDAFAEGSPIATAPAAVLEEWADADFLLPDRSFAYDPGDLKPIPYQEIDLNADWRSFDLQHDLTDAGIERFAADWNALLAEPPKVQG